MEGAGNETNALIEHELGTRTEGTIFAGGGPQLAAVGQDREANRIEDEAPVSHREATVCVSKDLESLEGSTGPVAHDHDMGLPIKAEMKVEAQVPHNGLRGDLVIRVGGLIHEVQAIRGRVKVDMRGAEIDEFCLRRFRGEVVAEEPFVTKTVLLMEEGVHLWPRGSPCKDDPIVNIHAQGGFLGCCKDGTDSGPEMPRFRPFQSCTHLSHPSHSVLAVLKHSRLSNSLLIR